MPVSMVQSTGVSVSAGLDTSRLTALCMTPACESMFLFLTC